jgi:hypothetical protein
MYTLQMWNEKTEKWESLKQSKRLNKLIAYAKILSVMARLSVVDKRENKIYFWDGKFYSLYNLSESVSNLTSIAFVCSDLFRKGVV